MEFLTSLPEEAFAPFSGYEDLHTQTLRAARATADFYLAHTPTDGVPYWDTIAADQHVPCGESTMWGDYHLREVALFLQRILTGAPYYTFWGTA